MNFFNNSNYKYLLLIIILLIIWNIFKNKEEFYKGPNDNINKCILNDNGVIQNPPCSHSHPHSINDRHLNECKFNDNGVIQNPPCSHSHPHSRTNTHNSGTNTNLKNNNQEQQLAKNGKNKELDKNDKNDKNNNQEQQQGQEQKKSGNESIESPTEPKQNSILTQIINSHTPSQTIPPKLGSVFNYILHDKELNTKQRLDLILGLTELYKDKATSKSIPKGSVEDNSRNSAIEKIIKELKNQIYSDKDNTINDNESLMVLLRKKIKNNKYFKLTDEEKSLLMRSNKNKIWETILQIENNRNDNNNKYEAGWSYVPSDMWETNNRPPVCLNDTHNVKSPAFVQGSGVPPNALDLKHDRDKYTQDLQYWGNSKPKYDQLPSDDKKKFDNIFKESLQRLIS